MKNKKRVILVLGVPRSGTSAITKSLEVLGVKLPELEKVAFNKFNEKGYWEDEDFFFFNLQLLNVLEPLEHRRRNLVSLTKKEVLFLEEQGFVEKASQLLLGKISDAKPLAIKTSSFSPLLPFWKKVFQQCAVQTSFVIALRNPFSVVASIQAAQEIIGKQDHEKSFWIWFSYMLSSLKETEGHQRLFIDYDQLIENPALQIQRMAHVFELEVNEELLRDYCDNFIDRSLCHFQEKENQLFNNQPCCDLGVEMYEALLKTAQDELSFQDLKTACKKWRDQFLLAESLLILVEKMACEIRSFKKLLCEREKKISTLLETTTKQGHSLLECYKTIHESNLQLASLMMGKKVP